MRACSTRRWRRSSWDELQARSTRRRAAGECVGAGLAIFVEKSGLGPFDGVQVTVDGRRPVEVVTGAASVGQGVETVIAQICADALGVDYARVRVVHGQTDRIAFGMGAFASRVTVMTGEATRLAAVEVRARRSRWRPNCCSSRRTRSTSSTARSCARATRRGRRSRSARSPRRWCRRRDCAASARRGSRRTAGSTPTT